MFAFKFMSLYEDLLMNFIYIWHDGRYMLIVLFREIPTLGCDLEVKVTDLEFSYKNYFLIKVYIAICLPPPY